MSINGAPRSPRLIEKKGKGVVNGLRGDIEGASQGGIGVGASSPSCSTTLFAPRFSIAQVLCAGFTPPVLTGERLGQTAPPRQDAPRLIAGRGGLWQREGD